MEGFEQSAGEVAAHDALHVGGVVTALLEQSGQLGEVGDGFEIGRGLLGAKAAVEIGADAAVACGAGELADVVNVIDHRVERDTGGLRCGLATHPAGSEHPGIECGTDDGIALGQREDHVVAELTIVRDEGAAVMMAGPDGAVVKFQRLPEGIVTKMRGIKDHAELCGLAQESLAFIA